MSSTSARTADATEPNQLKKDPDTDENAMLATLYCYDSDPNSLKLLLFILETGLLPRIHEVVHVTKHNKDAVESELKEKYPTNAYDAHPDYGIFPVCIRVTDDKLMAGADRIINMFMDEVLQHRNIDWKEMVVFNFFSCGMKLELELMKMENKQLTNTKLAYENLQEDYNSLRLQVKPNILSILADEMSSAGNGFKKLQLQHQVTLSQLNDALNDCKEQSRKNDQLEEENYTLKKDNNALLKEKNELRLMHKDEVDLIQKENARVTALITEHSNTQMQKLTSLIDDLKRLLAKDSTAANFTAASVTVTSGVVNSSQGNNVAAVDDSLEDGSPSETRCTDSGITESDTEPQVVEDYLRKNESSQQAVAVTVGESYDQDIEELRYLLKTSTCIPDLRKALCEREDEVEILKKQNSSLASKLAALESTLRE